MTQKRANVMNPTQSKRDEDVQYDYGTWKDDLRELQALGEEDLGAGYKITAMKLIATDKTREELEREERVCLMDALPTTAMFIKMDELMTIMARDRVLGKRDPMPKCHKSGDAMDVNVSVVLAVPPLCSSQFPMRAVPPSERGGGCEKGLRFVLARAVGTRIAEQKG